MPRIGPGRALKRALEGYWAGRVTADQLEETAASIRRQNWEMAAAAGVDFVPSNDFSLYDHMLDAAMLVALVLPLSSEVVTTLSARPNLLAFTLAAALLFAAAAWIGGSWATALGFAGGS